METSKTIKKFKELMQNQELKQSCSNMTPIPPIDKSEGILGGERFNELGIPMVDERMRQKLFPNTEAKSTKPAVYKAKQLLAPWGLDVAPKVEVNPAYVELPDLQGKNLKEHFDNMAYDSSRKYLAMADTLARVELPERPEFWVKQAGWTMYIPGESPKSVPYPIEPEIVFDVEVAVVYSDYSVMAVAVSSAAWYVWLSPWVITRAAKIEEFIPLGSGERFVAGWAIAYDRLRVAEAGEFEPNGLRFWDCMSMHISCVGLSSKQKNHYTSVKNKKQKAKDGGEEFNDFTPQWMDVTTTNSLKDAAEFYLGEKMDKNIRDVFVNGTQKEIMDKLDILIDYNADDVLKTHQIYQILWKRFRRQCPSDVTFTGMLIMGLPYLPITDSWNNFKGRCHVAYNKSKKRISTLLDTLALDYIEKAKENNFYKDDIWLKNLDWTYSTRAKLMKTKPAWYRKVKKNLRETEITSRARVVPYLLKMSWFGYPLLHSKDHGWGYLVSNDDSYETNLVPIMLTEYKNYKFYKLPHKDGESFNCGNPLAKDYLQYLESGTLRAEEKSATEIVELAISISYWTSVQRRVDSQFDVTSTYIDTDGVRKTKGFILPQMIVCGAVTRRAVEPTWLTASNPKENRIGSEIKTVVRVPKGYARLGADVDS
jgi:DNA polymerase gamma 1